MYKKVFSILAVILISGLLYGANVKEGKWSGYFDVFSGDQIELVSISAGPLTSSIKQDYDGIGLGFGFDYQNYFPDKMGYNVGISYGGQKVKDLDGGNFDYFLLNGLITMDVSEKIQLFSGLNFPLALASLTGDNGEERDFSGQLGFSLGVQAALTEKISLSLSYRTIKAKPSSEELDLLKANADIAGVSFSSKTVTVSEAFVLSTKYSF